MAKTFPKGISPKGIAVFPHLNKPDGKFNPLRPVYKTNLQLTDEDAEPTIDRIEKMLAALGSADPKVLAMLRQDDAERLQRAIKAKKAKAYDPPYAAATDREGNEVPGQVLLKFKSNASWTAKSGETIEKQLPLYDAKGSPTRVEIWGGSAIKVAYVMMPWCNAKGEYGVKLSIEAVQVIELRTAGAKDAAAFGFEAEEGFEDETPDFNKQETVSKKAEPKAVDDDDSSDF